MRDNSLKSIVKSAFFPAGVIRRIAFGPCAGLKYRVSDITGLSAWYSGTEREHQRAFASLVAPGDVVIDVGANWGLHTLYLSRHVGQAGMVIALEPFEPAWRELEWHIRANACMNVKVFHCALGDTNGQTRFEIGASAATGHLLGSDPEAYPSGKRVLDVTVRTLDSLMAELSPDSLKLIKIDVEGAESAVLRGAAATLRRFKPFLVIDLHTPDEDRRVAEFLTRGGFRLERLSKGPPIRRIDRTWPEPFGVWGTILARPLN